MKKVYTRDQIRDIVVDVLSGYTTAVVEATDVLLADLGLDSLDRLDHVKAVLELEDAFDIVIQFENAESWQTPDDIVDHIRDVLESPYTP